MRFKGFRTVVQYGWHEGGCTRRTKCEVAESKSTTKTAQITCRLTGLHNCPNTIRSHARLIAYRWKRLNSLRRDKRFSVTQDVVPLVLAQMCDVVGIPSICHLPHGNSAEWQYRSLGLEWTLVREECCEGLPDLTKGQISM
jgi:hypothetical protein